ncbi:DNA primase [Candidatus Fermentibacteria bacterium]|nr:DNA primase [Candidatus Fermentibacteria bacterium]
MTGGSLHGYDDVEKVRDASDIAEIVGRYVNLERSGRSLRGLCPFHKEKTPSFFVAPEKQVFHCFGCGEGGDVFTFLMKYFGISFSEALRELADEAGITLSRGRKDSDRSEQLLEILRESREFFYSHLFSDTGSGARSYLQGRQISLEIARRLGIGWAPPGNVLLEHLREMGYSESTIVETGVARRSRDGRRVYDLMRERIVFPIGDRSGRTVSFGGRALGDGEPKYLNGPETSVYRKGALLYGYREAREPAREREMVILVEGYFDHARLFESGFECVVATCGTALTPTQARHVSSLSPHILLCFDSDRSGRRSAVRAAEVLLQEGGNPLMVGLPQDMDPDDFLQKKGPEAFEKLLGSAMNPIDYGLWVLGGWEEVEGTRRRVDVVKRLVEVSMSASDPVVRETLLRTIGERTGYSMATLKEELEEISRRSRPGRRRRRKETDRLSRRESTLLRALLSSSGECFERLACNVQVDDFESRAGKELFEMIRRQAEAGCDRVSLGELGDTYSSLSARLMTDGKAPEASEVDRILSSVEVHRLERKRRQLRREMEELSDMSKRGEMLSRLDRLGRRIVELKSGRDDDR